MILSHVALSGFNMSSYGAIWIRFGQNLMLSQDFTGQQVQVFLPKSHPNDLSLHLATLMNI